jgi:spermidine synthase
VSWLFLIAYTCSGLAGLIYEVSWTRLLTLYIGQTTGAAAAVVAAFLGGLAAGAAIGGSVATRLSPRRCLQVYIALEAGVAAAALILPAELSALTPLLKWAYRDGAAGLLFPSVRLLTCLLLVFVPATALGATFPMAIRWFANDQNQAARATGALYLVNTAGAAIGAILAGFVLIPAIGIFGTTLVGVGASISAALSVLVVIQKSTDLKVCRHDSTSGNDSTPGDGDKPLGSGDQPLGLSASGTAGGDQPLGLSDPKPGLSKPKKPKRSQRAAARESAVPDIAVPRWLAVVVLGLSGFATLVHEIAWTRILTLVLGPTTYAFAATVAAVIVGIAIGSGIGAWLVGRTNRPTALLAFVVAFAALTTSWTYSIAGRQIPSQVAHQIASSSNLFEDVLRQGALLTAGLILPTAICMGAAFPLALAIARRHQESAAGRFGIVYAVNTLGAVSGSLAAGFLLIPAFGLRSTLILVSLCLIAAALIVVAWGGLTRRAQAVGLVTAAAAAAAILLSPPWDRELLASGVYMYAGSAPKDVDLDTLLRAGTLLYYKEGSASTVSVKRLTGTTTLAVDGKVDASNRGDMLTQKLIAHLPLLLYDSPRDVGIVGLGSGVTLGAALSHPIARADVIEISPEVVEASRFFDAENGKALSDSRARLIVGDGRSHLQLTSQQYDVIISEPSNPWIAGVAALFTREFFLAARERLRPGGIMSQWANAYNISDQDLRSIVATFRSVFPDGTIWLVGRDDVLLVGGREPIDDRLARIAESWKRSHAAADLAKVAVLDPFSIWTLFVGGPREMERYSQGAPLLDDDRMTLEFSAPRELHQRRSGENTAALVALTDASGGPVVVRDAKKNAGAAEWSHRGAMFARADVHRMAYDDYVRALTLDPTYAPALDGLVRAATLTRSAPDALAKITSLSEGRQPTVDLLVARSKLLAAAGKPADAIEMTVEARRLAPASPVALEQEASLRADAGDLAELRSVVEALKKASPDRPSTRYYEAVSALLDGHPDEAVRLAQMAIAIDPSYAPVYDLIGAAYTKLDRLAEGREAFNTSLTFDAHDSAAYINLGLVELAAGNRAAAVNHFAEALWLEPDSRVAREGLARALR